jgi:parvulin-like peptidyl-prolyl isomerase
MQTPNLRILPWALALLIGHELLPILFAQESNPPIAATVDDQAVLVKDVLRELEKVPTSTNAEGINRDYLIAATLQRLIDRRLAEQWIQRSGEGATGSDVELARDRLKKRLERAGKTLDDYCREQDLDPIELQRLLRWQIGWQAFLDRYLTDDNLRKYFAEHRREFDGTRLKVAQILLRVEPPGDKAAQQAVLRRARTIRQEILEGKIRFADAAREYSQAPSANQGGDIGFISRREPMPESFSRAAFALETGETSVPVVSALGVHLIHCLDEEAGLLQWEQAREELERAVREYLFQWAAARERSRATVRFTGAVPYLDPETRELVR